MAKQTNNNSKNYLSIIDKTMQSAYKHKNW